LHGVTLLKPVAGKVLKVWIEETEAVVIFIVKGYYLLNDPVRG